VPTIRTVAAASLLATLILLRPPRRQARGLRIHRERYPTPSKKVTLARSILRSRIEDLLKSEINATSACSQWKSLDSGTQKVEASAPSGLRRSSPVLLEEQDRTRRNHLLVHRGLQALTRSTSTDRPIATYILESETADGHARASHPDDTDWPRIAAWYDVLSAHTSGPVVELNCAIAHGRAFGPGAGLRVLDTIHAPPRSHLLAAVRGDLLDRAARTAQAATLSAKWSCP
jgi:hypothetical protein